MRKNIFLCGFMGAGKSTVGKCVADKLSIPFYDTDKMVTESAGATVAEIFSTSEEKFRQLETKEIFRLESLPVGVVALGGGAFKDPVNLQAVQKNGFLIYLGAEPTTLHARLQLGEVESRPLLKGLSSEARLQKITELLAAREYIYKSADLTVTTDGKSTEIVCEEIVRELKRGRF